MSLLALCVCVCVTVCVCVYIYIYISANNLKITEQSKTSVFLPIIVSGIADVVAS